MYKSFGTFEKRNDRLHSFFPGSPSSDKAKKLRATMVHVSDLLHTGLSINPWEHELTSIIVGRNASSSILIYCILSQHVERRNIQNSGSFSRILDLLNPDISYNPEIYAKPMRKQILSSSSKRKGEKPLSFAPRHVMSYVRSSRWC